MTAYDLMCKRNNFQDRIETLESYLVNDTETALLTSDEIEDIVECLKEARTLVDIQLSKIKID